MTIILSDDALIDRIARLAEREHRAPQDIVADAVSAYEGQAGEGGPEFLRSIIALGHSGQHDVARRADEIVATELDPKSGWSLKQK